MVIHTRPIVGKHRINDHLVVRDVVGQQSLEMNPLEPVEEPPRVLVAAKEVVHPEHELYPFRLVVEVVGGQGFIGTF